MFPECVRALLLVGQRERAQAYRLGPSESVQARAHAGHIEGLLEMDVHRAIDLLRQAVAELEALEMRMHAARAMVDLGRAMTRVGEDARPVLERAREILLECDARLFLAEVDDVLAELDG